MPDQFTAPTGWWITSLRDAIATACFSGLALCIPISYGKPIFTLGVLILLVTLLRNKHWRRQVAGTCIGIAAALLLSFLLNEFLSPNSLGILILRQEATLGLAGLFLIGGLSAALVESEVNRRLAQTLQKSRDHNTAINITIGGEPLLTTARRHGVNLDDYLTNLLAEVDHIDIKGISTSNREAMVEPIENLYTPLRSRDPSSDHSKDRRVILPELLQSHVRLLLVGKPGAGKTTFIHLVTCMLARDIKQPRPNGGAPWREEYLGIARDHPPPLPALIRLRDLVDELRKPGAGCQPSDRGWVLQLLASRTRPADVADDHGESERKQQWDRWLERGDAILLMDGLDEVGDIGIRDRVIKIVRSACMTWPKCRVLITSRPILIDALTVHPLCFHTAWIDDFGSEEIERFISQWSAALFARTPHRGIENTRSLIDAIRDRTDLREFSTNPVMLTCLCVIHYNERGELPHGRARVYRAIVSWMRRARENQRRERSYHDGLAENALECLALAMMEGPNGRAGKVAVIDFGDAATVIESQVRRYFRDEPDIRRKAEIYLRDECELSGLIEEVAGNRLKFWHLTFQEFLASWTIARRGDWWDAIESHISDPQWEETLALFSGCLFEAGGQGRVDELILRILTRGGGEGKGLLAKATAIAVIGKVLEPMQAYEYQEDPHLIAQQNLLAKQVMAIFTTDGAAEVSATLRIAAAKVIGLWGDPRLTGDEFLQVPGTELKLGRFPVTVAEYSGFIKSYNDQQWWSEKGWAWKQKFGRAEPWKWKEQMLYLNQPIFGISWFEAEAYCQWLSKERGELVRLPTAHEWEQAAGDATGRFPWGETEPNVDLTNCGRTIGSPTPVGVYPAGAGPFGHLDLAGNVWEWCLDGPDHHKDSRWLKGGNWCSDPEQLVIFYRDKYSHMSLDGDQGFRVCIARATQISTLDGHGP